MFDAGLVLEGGGMKGVFTAGVLDFFMDNGIEFKDVYGVSAGACCMTGYLANQKGHTRDVFVDYIDMRQYMGVRNLVTTGDVINADFSYNLVPNFINPFDYEAFKKSKMNGIAVVTNIETGEPEYIKIEDAEKDVLYIRASSSLPLVSKSVKIDGKLYLDGGISDSIPIMKSEADGNKKNVVIMTKPIGYRRIAESKKNLAAFKLRYLRYPKVYELMKNRYIAYDTVLDYVEGKAKNGELFLIRPVEDAKIGRLEKDKDKLLALYDDGYNEGKRQYEAMLEYLNK